MSNALKNINWRKLFYVFLWCLAIVGTGFLVSFINVKSEAALCTDVEVIIPGEQSFIARTDVDRVLKNTQGDLIGQQLSSIPVHKIEDDLRAIPFIKKAIVTFDLSGKIRIKIQQREATLRVINLAGGDFYLDDSGVKMPLSSYYAPHVLVANGWVAESYGKDLDSIQTPMLRDLYDISRFIAADTLWNSQIEQLFVNAEKQIEMIPRVGTQTIIIGNAQDLDEKFKKLSIFYDKVIPAAGWDAYRLVDLSFKNQLVCEKKEQTN